MTALDRARAHLRKAQEFLEAAELNVDLDLFNAATSNAVTSGINSKDAICLKLTGRTGKTDNHSDAIAELTASGPAGAAQVTNLRRLLSLKLKSQYQATDVAAADARKAIERARRLYEAATVVVAG